MLTKFSMSPLSDETPLGNMRVHISNSYLRKLYLRTFEGIDIERKTICFLSVLIGNKLARKKAFVVR